MSKIHPPLDGISLTQKDNRPPAKIGPEEVKKKAKSEKTAPKVKAGRETKKK